MSASHVRGAARVSLAAIAVVLGLVLGSGVAQALTPEQQRTTTDNYMFSQSLGSFQNLRAQRAHAPYLDWGSDGCSWSPDEPFGWEFIRACYRHDFGYRNYKKQGRFTESTRLTIDNKFKSDMYSICGSNWFCKRAADTYYAAVRQFGASSVGTAHAVAKAKAAKQVTTITATG